MARRTRHTYSQDEQDLLAMCVCTSLEEGKTVSDGLKEFITVSGNMRAMAGVRKFWTLIRKQYAEQERAARARSNNWSYYTDPLKQTIKNDEIDNDKKAMTQRDLIRLLRTTEIVDPNARSLQKQLSRVSMELEQKTKDLDVIRKERDDCKRQLSKMEDDLAKCKDELATVLKAMEVARDHFLGRETVKTKVDVSSGEVIQATLTKTS